MSDTTRQLPAGDQLSSLHEEFQSHTSLKPKSSSLLSSCRICLSSIFDPAYLTCGHKFCKSCLHQYWQSGDRPASLACPLCRAIDYYEYFTVEDDTEPVGELQKNFSLELSKSTLTCFKISMLLPVLYCIVKWLK